MTGGKRIKACWIVVGGWLHGSRGLRLVGWGGMGGWLVEED